MHLTKIQISNYRGIKNLDLDLAPTTVLIGENNCGKTTVLHALRACLQTLKNSGRSTPFDEFDFHFNSQTADPTTAPKIEIILTFEESKPGEWSDKVEQKLGGDGGVISFIPPDDRGRVQLRVNAEYSMATQDIDTTFDFLDAAGNPLNTKNRSRLGSLQQLRPLFYLSALRDAGREFSRTSQFWSPFVKNSQIDESTKTDIEEQLGKINAKIIEAHGTFKDVREHLSKVQELVAIGEQDVVSVDAVPARIFDILNRTQVSIASTTGARLPIGRHGEGTQSLTVLMLFDAFLKSELTRRQGLQDSKPIVALEEPEAHLHPNAVRALWKTINDIDGQKLIATHSGDLLSEVDIYSIRRLYKKGSVVQVGALQAKTLDKQQLQKFDHFVRRSRGELFFARAWILVEGETDVIILSGAARVLGIDLEQSAVRLVEYAQVGLSTFINAADSLGVMWHVFSDGDEQGHKTAGQVRSALNGKQEAKHLTLLPNDEPLEPYLCRNGFIDVYEQHASDQKRPKHISVSVDDENYPNQLYKCLPSNKKPAAAHDVVAKMQGRGIHSIPKEISDCLKTIITLAGGN